ncbi:putative ABC exporter domain-containing protein [Hyalangium rubrum]|uniref:ABC exporter domain-containing protein n=1 Tax=Hyalangium rubrum TaxID=3103134 RepID=A0ABU5HAU7_9BACT|nr:putative ABC exporter domain-containing protein [Hyalangium sp. s54d21]MDY7229948.1 putative ABC exporter domain-containing protein [Hyalangium sp. s54d21]
MSFPRAVAFLWWASLRNRVRRQMQRLRQPKYLVGLLVGGAYLYAVLIRRLNFRGSMEVVPPEGRMFAELPLAAMALATLGAAWAFGQDRPALTFSEAEVQQLFSAPVSRRGLLHYKLARGLFGALTGAFFTTLFVGRAVSPHPLLFFVGATVSLAIVNLHVTAASFVRVRLARLGWLGTALRWAVLGGLFVALGLASHSALEAHPLPVDTRGQTVVRDWLYAVLEEPALRTVLWPGRMLVALPMASGVGEFVRALPLSLGLLLAHYLWVSVLIVPFEEAVVVRVEERARLRGPRMARVGNFVLRRPFFQLVSRGRPEVALLWKNLIAARRIGGPEILLVLALLGLAFPVGTAFFAPESLSSVRQIMASVYLFVAAILTVFGPVSLRSDLRMDLPKLDLLRAMPLTGSQVVAAELLAPGLLLAIMQWVLLALAVGMALGVDLPWGSALWVAGALGVAPLLTALTFGGLFVQNAAVVLFPTWLPADGERARGIEALGQRVLTLAGSLLVLVGGLVPAVLVASLVGFALAGWLGVWALPFAGLTAAAGLFAEVLLGVAALGRAFDRMDVSSEP